MDSYFIYLLVVVDQVDDEMIVTGVPLLPVCRDIVSKLRRTSMFPTFVFCAQDSHVLPNLARNYLFVLLGHKHPVLTPLKGLVVVLARVRGCCHRGSLLTSSAQMVTLTDRIT